VEVYVPHALAYGSVDDQSRRPEKVGPRAALIFQIELLSIHSDGSRKAVAPEGGWETISGISTKFRTLKPGKGKTVQPGDQVTVHATGSVAGKQPFWTTAGSEPFSFRAAAGEVITGWDKGCLGMKQGEERELDIPSAEGYGDVGFPAWQIPGDAQLLFKLEVLRIEKEEL